MGVTSEMITQKEEDILNMLNQPQDTVERSDSGNRAQLPTVGYFFFSVVYRKILM